MLHTLQDEVTHSVEIKHSRFTARACHVTDSSAALAWLAKVSITDATHNCWAWRMGDDYRSSDDGEPSGTAGRPILAAIDGQGFDLVVVVVTRWYGGIKLGAGGLVRAYGGAAAELLRTATRVPLVQMAEVMIEAEFADIGSVHALIAAQSIEKLDEQFSAHGVRLHLRLPADTVDTLRQRLRDVTRDKARLTLGQT